MTEPGVRVPESSRPTDPASPPRLLTGISALAVADIAAFVWSRRQSLLRGAPGRASGSAALLGLWSALAVCSSLARRRDRGWTRASNWLAVVCGNASLALMAVHLKVGKGRARALPGAVLGVAALAARVGRPV